MCNKNKFILSSAVRTYRRIMKNTLRLGLLTILGMTLTPAVHTNPNAHKAVLLIDVQSSFTTANSFQKEKRLGSLAVANSGDEYLTQVNTKVAQLKALGYTIIASQDFHPANHMSFASNNPGKNVFEVTDKTIPTQDGSTKTVTQVMWPDHCVQGTPGADILVPADLIDEIVQKGKNPDCDSYSAFKDDGGQPTGLAELLKKRGITEVYALGIATDYCVNYTVNHALENDEPKLNVFVFEDLCRGVDHAASLKAIAAMRAKGANIITSNSIQ
jgi:nicotinamidase/pyrazinamidase